MKGTIMKKSLWFISLTALLLCSCKQANKEVQQKDEVDTDSLEVAAQDSIPVFAEMSDTLLFSIEDFRAFLDSIDTKHAEKCVVSEGRFFCWKLPTRRCYRNNRKR